MPIQAREISRSVNKRNRFILLCNLYVKINPLYSALLIPLGIIVLDPRYKRAFFIEAPRDEIFSAEWVKECHEDLTTTFLVEYALPAARSQSPVKRSGSSKVFSFGDPAVFAPAGQTTFQAPSPDAEIKKYESEPCIAGQEDPLLWWKANASRFPALAEMARVYLAIPGMSY